MSTTSFHLWRWVLVAAGIAAWPASLSAQLVQGQEMVVVNPGEAVHELLLSSQVATTVTFPGDITLVTGYGMVSDAEKAETLMAAERKAAQDSGTTRITPITIIQYEQASPDVLVLRAVRAGSPCYMTVRCQGRMFLFKAVAGEQANLAVVIPDPTVTTVREVAPQEAVKERTKFSSAELVGILSKARQRDFLQGAHPALYHGWNERRNIDLRADHGSLASIIDEIQQWPDKDALILRCWVENKSDKVQHFKPSDVKIRAGDRSYPVQLADSSGTVAPKGKTSLDLVLQGNPNGGKEHLSIENDFRLELAVDNSPPTENLIDTRSNPLLPVLPPGTVLDASSGK